MIPGLVFSFVLGLIMGSFLNMLIYRLPRNMNIAVPPSACPLCGVRLGWKNNIPLLSYLIQSGRCGACKGAIPRRYLIVELTVSILFCLIFLQSGVTLYTAKIWMFVFLLAGAAFTDVETRLAEADFECGMIPDVYTVGGVACGYIWALVSPEHGVGLYEALAGSGAGFFALMIPGFLYTLVRKVEGIGVGDALLMACVGSFMGVKAVLLIFTLSAFIGTVIGIAVVAAKKDNNYLIPFAPAIAVASVFYVFAGRYISI